MLYGWWLSYCTRGKYFIVSRSRQRSKQHNVSQILLNANVFNLRLFSVRFFAVVDQVILLGPPLYAWDAIGHDG